MTGADLELKNKAKRLFTIFGKRNNKELEMFLRNFDYFYNKKKIN